jgi:predicted RNA-binding Zn-ribbon protein involved in translation (DUF1610 family)
MAWFGGLALACFIIIPITVEFLRSRQASWPMLMLPFVFVAPVLLMAFIIQRRLFASYKCPGCGVSLPTPQRERGRLFEAKYYCPDCDVVWETGVKESND